MITESAKVAVTDSMITISTSVGETENAVSELKELTIQVLESNQVLAERMANLELQHSAYALSKAPNSIQEVEDHHGKSGTTLRLEPVFDDDETSADLSILPPNNDGEDQDNESMVTVRRIGPITTESLPVVDGFAFEQDLLASRPYARAINRRPCLSTTSSVVPTMGWSYLSGISLADVSEVSILSLPLSPLELWNGHRYVTARNDLQASEGDNEQPKQASIARMRNMKTPLYQAASSWPFGKLFERWDPFIGKPTHEYTILSENVVLLGTTYTRKVIVPSKAAGSITDREKECLSRANAQFFDAYSYCMDIVLMRLIAYKPVVTPSFATSWTDPWWRGETYGFQRWVTAR